MAQADADRIVVHYVARIEVKLKRGRDKLKTESNSYFKTWSHKVKLMYKN